MIRPEGLRLPLAAAAAFVLFTALAVGGWAPLRTLDLAVADTFREIGRAHPALIAWVRVATDVAATIPFLTAGALVTLFLAVRGERRRAVFTVVTFAAVATLWSLMHVALPHVRPGDAFVTVTSYGFPSGHTSNAAAAALVLAVLLAGRVPRPALITVAVTFAVLVGLSRLILLAHYPTQVAGGWLLALAVVPAAAHWLLPRTPAKPRHPATAQPHPPGA